ncbi:hypothetical protein JTE90_029171 [Oedothorax gibbosus]|uniref:Secreted protein n=1 Tax=Oedothorax gibbosus TaxID=931172 RepID=A0AAV6VDL9_9ARAC|nr:hypothetical protein JTE90_029171 [Oedothorax gibbosus]
MLSTSTIAVLRNIGGVGTCFARLRNHFAMLAPKLANQKREVGSRDATVWSRANFTRAFEWASDGFRFRRPLCDTFLRRDTSGGCGEVWESFGWRKFLR